MACVRRASAAGRVSELWRAFLDEAWHEKRLAHLRATGCTPMVIEHDHAETEAARWELRTREALIEALHRIAKNVT